MLSPAFAVAPERLLRQRASHRVANQEEQLRFGKMVTDQSGHTDRPPADCNARVLLGDLPRDRASARSVRLHDLDNLAEVALARGGASVRQRERRARERQRRHQRLALRLHIALRLALQMVLRPRHCVSLCVRLCSRLAVRVAANNPLCLAISQQLAPEPNARACRFARIWQTVQQRRQRGEARGSEACTDQKSRDRARGIGASRDR
mmetsp:Transcript_4243/g.9232  ORF Transcript_4243/g.9232 Transcript_4243/m.9232 type:complete len:207 (+) Transcript_4243:1328-1948(+)